MGLIPRQKRPNPIKQGIERAAFKVASDIHEQWFENGGNTFDIPLGKKPPKIPGDVFLSLVSETAKPLLKGMCLGGICVGLTVEFNQEASVTASKHLPRYSGFGNTPQPIYDFNDMHIVFDRLPPQLALVAVEASVEQVLPVQSVRAS